WYPIRDSVDPMSDRVVPDVRSGRPDVPSGISENVTGPFRGATIHDVKTHLSERLLSVMDKKNHWAYPSLTRPGLSREQLLVHFRHEYLVFVRDFPVLVARALGQVPPFDDVRAALAENLYEEQTGGISKTGPHPALFL